MRFVIGIGISLLLGCALAACSRQAAPTEHPSASQSAQDASGTAAQHAAAPRDATHPRLLVTTTDGKGWDLANQRGYWVVVNFWATWCGPCLQEMPALSAFAAKRADVRVIGLAYEDIDKAGMDAFLKLHAPKYPVAILDVYHPPQDFEPPRGLPTSYLIAPDGSVAKKFVGPLAITDIEQAITATLPVH